MPPPKKLDMIPDDVRRWLIEELRANGYGNIVAITDELNIRLEEVGHPETVGKSSVGDLNLMLKEQAAAFEVAEQLIGAMDIEAEGDLQKQLYHLISATAMQSILKVRGEGEHITADASAKYAKMMKDLMSSSGMREKLLDAERERIAREAREALEAEQSARLDGAVAAGRVDAEAAQRAREIMGFA